MNDVTKILNAMQHGQAKSEDLLPLLYGELRQIAGRHMREERANHTLQPTALVHEAYLRLLGDADATWQNRRHFLGAAATAMQRILVENARQQKQIKRGGELERVELRDADLAAEIPESQTDLQALDAALQQFQTTDSSKAELVRLRYFAGLSEEDVAATLGISKATASRWWTYSRAWLYSKMQDKSSE